MGWWPSIFGGNDADPIDKLDPKLREFLDKESPVKYYTGQQQQPPAPEPPTSIAARIASAAGETSPATTTKATQDENAVPSASLYQDGRYAHLWKNYKPQAQIEAEGATDHDKLMSVLDGFQERKSAMARVAMENCAEWQEKWINCMKHGEWKDQAQMCRHQVRRFEQCYTMQSRFLRALGYGSVPGRSPQIEEDIQMHADALYQRVLQHEDAVEQAQKDGRPIPKFDPVIPKAGGGNAAPRVEASEEVQEQWRERLEKLPEEERAVEEAALQADLETKSAVARNLRDILEAKKKDDGEPKPNVGVSDAIFSLLRGGK